MSLSNSSYGSGKKRRRKVKDDGASPHDLHNKDTGSYNPIFKKLNQNAKRGFKFKTINKGTVKSAEDIGPFSEKKIEYLNYGSKLSQIEENSYDESREDTSKHHNDGSSTVSREFCQNSGDLHFIEQDVEKEDK